MQHESAYKMTAVKSLGQDVVEQYHRVRDAFLKEHIREAEVVVIVYDVQILDGFLIRYLSAGKTHHLVEYGKSVTHAAVRFLCNYGKCFLIGCDTLFLCHRRKVLYDVLVAYAAEIVNLATGQYGGDDLMLLGCGKDENGILGRFLQCLEEGVEGSL